LVIGLVGAIGANLSGVADALTDALKDVGYTAQEIRVVDLLHSFKDWAGLPERPVDERYTTHIEAGRQFCEKIGTEDGLARLAVANIRRLRRDATGDYLETRARHAYLLRSLKRRGEVELLRSTYGPSFLLVAAYSPRLQRIEDLAQRFARSRNQFDADAFRERAEHLVEVDEKEGTTLGQNVRETFPLADVFVRTESPRAIREALVRFIEILFAFPFHTPTRDEAGMMHARVSALRSSDLSRQVGCTIATAAGDIVSLGTNEAPSYGGGVYWPDTERDARDFQKRSDTSWEMRRLLLADALQRIEKMGWLSPDASGQGIDRLVDESLLEPSGAVMRDSRLMDVIEFGRTVHAEMDAIGTAAKRGVAIKGCTMYVTTFPCHICARHIVSTGIERVVYIEPYHKSLASDLFGDSIAVDDPRKPTGYVQFEHFVGLSPSKYEDLFAMVRRRSSDGAAIVWNKATAEPRLYADAILYMHKERELLSELKSALSGAGLTEFELEEG
jgi:cytidine deaminase